jgi:histidinol-phosphate aminotransferase
VTSRRSFLRSLGIGTATATAAQWPFGSINVRMLERSLPIDSDRLIHLDNNENAYGPSSRTLAAMREPLTLANRYPGTHIRQLTEKIGSFHGVNAEQVVLGCGSTEILRMACDAYLGSGKQMLQSTPTFEALQFYARSVGAEVISLPLTHEFAHDLQAMLGKITTSTTLIYICNPNNPTGSITPRKGLEEFISKLPSTAFVLIDEAYHHYAGQSSMYASFIDNPVNNSRVIVTRTFSAVYGLAGLRLGYAITSPETARQMRRFSTINNTNSIVAQAAMAALSDKESVENSVKQNTDDRQEFFNQAMARMLKPIDSHTNFVMMNTNRPAKQVIEHFRQHGIIIGPNIAGMEHHIRVSLGTPTEMREFWRVWDQLPNAGVRM